MQTLQKELQGHAPRLAEVLERGEAAAEGSCLELAERARELRAQWEALREEVAARQQRLREASEAQQYYLDAGEAEMWVSEQELFMGDEEKPKVRVALHCLPVSSGDSVPCSVLHAVLCCYAPSHAILSHAVPGHAISWRVSLCAIYPSPVSTCHLMPCYTVHTLPCHPTPCYAITQYPVS